MVNYFSGLSRQFLQQLLPRYCLLCDRHTLRDHDICSLCETDLPPQPESNCYQCALPLEDDCDIKGTTLCGHCLTKPPLFSRCIAGWPYQFPVAELITQFKHQQQLSHGLSLAKLMRPTLDAYYLDQPLPDIVTSAPLHWRREWQRGYNQSHLIAKVWAKHLRLPLQPLLKRHRHTPAQQDLNAKQRQANLKAAFLVTAPEKLTGKTIALVDDVVTTMASCNEMSRCLLDAGAKDIHVWCLARTAEHRQKTSQ